MGIRVDRKNYVMSVEFALQREFDYRHKLQNQALKPSQFAQVSGSAATEIPRTMPPQPPLNPLHPNHGPIRGLQNPRSLHARPSPYPYPPPSTTPTQTPSAGPSCSAAQRRKAPVPLPDGVFTCKVCQIDCKTGFNLLNHYQGQKHKAKLRGTKGKEVASVAVSPAPKVSDSDRRPYCDVCGIWCADEYTFRLHFNCTNHILKQYDNLIKTRVYS
ncbi:unnamed protein product [Amaranthus hypochondriacus]